MLEEELEGWEEQDKEEGEWGCLKNTWEIWEWDIDEKLEGEECVEPKCNWEERVWVWNLQQ